MLTMRHVGGMLATSDQPKSLSGTRRSNASCDPLLGLSPQSVTGPRGPSGRYGFSGADDGIRTRDPHLGNCMAVVSCVSVGLSSASELHVLGALVSSVSPDRWSRLDFVGDFVGASPEGHRIPRFSGQAASSSSRMSPPSTRCVRTVGRSLGHRARSGLGSGVRSSRPRWGRARL